MIARPKISRNEWKPAELGAFEVGNFALLSCPGRRRGRRLGRAPRPRARPRRRRRRRPLLHGALPRVPRADALLRRRRVLRRPRRAEARGRGPRDLLHLLPLGHVPRGRAARPAPRAGARRGLRAEPPRVLHGGQGAPALGLVRQGHGLHVGLPRGRGLGGRRAQESVGVPAGPRGARGGARDRDGARLRPGAAPQRPPAEHAGLLRVAGPGGRRRGQVRVAPRGALGDAAAAAEFERRAGLYREYYDADRRLMAAREPGGAFVAAAGEAFDPAGAFEEGTPLQYTFMVPGDAEGLAALLGGPDALGDRLDDYFLRASMANPTRQLDLTTGTIGGHCQGNEPGHHAPYLYNVANRPWRTAETIDAINELYTASEIPGNDDVGQTSAWFAWSALGLYPVDPCGDRLHLGKPLFMRADVDVRATLDGAARVLTILGDGCRDRGAHVQSVWFEGSRVAAHEVAWADVANGGVLRFVKMVCVWRLVLATFACVGKSEGFCCWWSATGDPCDCSETSKASNLATSLACVDGGGSWCSEDGEQSAPEDGEQSAAVRRGRAVRARPGPRHKAPVGRFHAGAPPRTIAAPAYSEEEVSALRGIFALYDPDGTGEIGSNDLENLFKKIGFFNYAAVELIKQFDVEEPKTIDFAKFLEMVKAGQPDQPGEEPDRKPLDGGEQSAPEDGSSSCACRSIMAGIIDEWCQLSDCDPAFAAQCSSACPTAPGATPDGCERNWLFQVSTGRSGSTSLMAMLNDLPNVYIAGENDGLFESLYALHKSSIRTERESKNGVYHGAWWHHPTERANLR
ncbi:hypothetical protein AURANDRAFT_72486 [Aureococcus anophagefferens]|uniref:EF-hand domain-containing protein n=1 Tax=Aureococcus anophagefferens TaxID=44056 RepID=F0YJX6_AURAN|nr:hypothetical protein AURANDRAFT_72486 [Aureococcus anophagefferens]EGB04582.1 hypothetical protein AURANDRAFT_72486 [Aureococcus anophagefferens]|eukprot:XP_009040689.1 hypothetical protein AURANDRAFT_72486 [Aureococcus anophagefferens]